MALTFISTPEAEVSEELVMTVVTEVPSPWGEAAKAILLLKEMEFKAVAFSGRDEAQIAWTGQTNAPCLVKKGEPTRSSWLDILLYAERVLPEPRLIPSDPLDRALMIGFAHEIMGEEGLIWARRIQLIHMGLMGSGGFPLPVAKHLAGKYGATTMDPAAAEKRVEHLITMIADRLISQQSVGSGFLIGRELTALDIYVATAMAIFKPLPEAQCKMHPVMRPVFETAAPDAIKGLMPSLFAFRDRIVEEHLALPADLAPAIH